MMTVMFAERHASTRETREEKEENGKLFPLLYSIYASMSIKKLSHIHKITENEAWKLFFSVISLFLLSLPLSFAC